QPRHASLIYWPQRVNATAPAEVQSELDYAAVAGMPISAGSVCPRIGVSARPNYLIFGEGGTASFGAQLRLP
ncbi:MAG TPA: hypothetical protein VER34_14950, partial [Mycobacterium sp.]|nr:hypothetical protein [Mycobacterium sp.]